IMADGELRPARVSRLRAMGRAFAGRNYRLFFAGQGVSLVGTWMSRLATGWLVFRLGGADAPWLLGVVSFAGLAPAFFLGPAAGEAWCFVIDAVSYLAVVAALLAMRLPGRERTHAAASVGRHLVEGVRYAFGFPPIRALLLLLALVSFAAMPQAVLLPVFAADVLGGGAHTLGLLSAASGVGAFAGAVYLASRSSVLGLGKVIVAATV